MTLAGSAVLALVIGVAVYVLDRDWGSAAFLAPLAVGESPTLGLFGPAGSCLPSLLHAYALSILIMLVLPPGKGSRTLAAGGWFFVAAGLETFQHAAAVAILWPDGSPAEPHPLSAMFRAYAIHGRFDPADLAATAVGCLLAFLLASMTETHSCAL